VHSVPNFISQLCVGLVPFAEAMRNMKAATVCYHSRLPQINFAPSVNRPSCAQCKRLKPMFDKLLSNSAVNFNLRLYTMIFTRVTMEGFEPGHQELDALLKDIDNTICNRVYTHASEISPLWHGYRTAMYPHLVEVRPFTDLKTKLSSSRPKALKWRA